VIPRANPAPVIRRQSAAGHHAVYVGMRLQGLAPGMKNAQEADLGPEVRWGRRRLRAVLRRWPRTGVGIRLSGSAI
jgi:hypothetical protein